MIRMIVSQEIRSIPPMVFRKSGSSSSLSKSNSRWNNKNIPLLLLTGIAAKKSCSWSLPTALLLTSSKTWEDSPLSCSVILVGALWSCLNKRIIFLLSGKSPRHLVPACFIPQISQRMSVLASLVSCLLYFVDESYFTCWQTGTTWSLSLLWFGPGLLMCILGTRCLPNLQNGVIHEYFPLQFLDVVSPCSTCIGVPGAVITSIWPRVVEVNRKRPGEFQLVLGQPPSDWPNKASNNILN